MYIDNDNYELSNNIEIDTLLAELPFELIKENIKEQINDPLYTSVDYANIIVEKCDLLKADFFDNEDAYKNIVAALRDFFIFIITEIDNKFSLDIDLDNESDESIINIGETLYNYLILRYKKNISKFIYKFIIKNKKNLTEHFDKLSKKKDVTSISLKKQIKNRDDILIISNLPSVIKYVMGLYIEPLDFIKYSCDEDYYEGSVVRKLINNGILIGNFVSNYFEIIVDENDDVLDDIQTDIKLKLMKKL